MQISKKILFSSVFSVCAALLAQQKAYAKAGDLDAMFGVGGFVSLPTLGAEDTKNLSAVAVQADGKILFGASTLIAGGSGVGLTIGRLMPNGSLDASYGSAGIRSLLPAVHDSQLAVPTRLIYSPTGDAYLLSGSVDVYSPQIFKINLDGVMDTSFGINGVATPPNCEVISCDIEAMRIDNQGRLLVAGVYQTANVSKIYLARLNENGQPDLSFNVTGQADLPQVDASHTAIIQDVNISIDNKIVLTGAVLPVTYVATPPGGAYISRLNSDGSLDNSFASNGVFISILHNRSASDAKVLADGSILVTGALGKQSDASINPRSGLSVWKLTSAGVMDSTFGDHGSAYLPGAGDNYALRIATSSNGKILISGSHNSKGALARFTPQGAVDTSYGAGGVSYVGNAAAIYDMALQADDKAVSVKGYSDTDGVYRTKGGALSVLGISLFGLLFRRRAVG